MAESAALALLRRFEPIVSGTQRLVVCISASQASAAFWRSGQIARLEQFAHDARGLAEFRAFLAAYPNTPVFMIVDAVEEDYRVETLPHGRGGERRDMVTRKLRQYYRGTPYVGAWLQGREGEKRRDDRYLFAALTRPELPDDWLNVVKELALPLAGLYLVPTISAGLLQKLEVKAKNILLVVQHTENLRLTFFRDLQLRVSRLARVEAAGAANRVRLLSGEISNTRLYLHALRTVALDEPMTVVLVDHREELGELTEAITRDNPMLTSVRFGRADLASRLGLQPHLLNTGSDAIYLQVLGAQLPKTNIAPAAATVGFQRFRAERTIYGACIAAAVVATLWTGVNGWLAYDLGVKAAEVSRQIVAVDEQYRQVTRDFPPAPTSGQNMKNALDIALELRDTARDPLRMMVILSDALESTPNVSFREFGWRYGLSQIERGMEDAAPAPTEAPKGGALPVRRQSGYLVGEITPFRGDYRAAIATINAFAERLRKNPAVEQVRFEKMPLDLNPKAALSGSPMAAQGDHATAQFELTIVFRQRA